MGKLKTNKVFVVGTVQEVNTNIGTAKNGKTYIGGKIIVRVDTEPQSLIEFKLFAFETTNAGTTNKMFESYKKLDGFLQKRVRVSGELQEGSMVNQSNGTINKFNEIRLTYVNNAKADEKDCATFEFGGFVTKAIYERKNKDDELIGYRIEVGQANYNDTNMQVIKFDVDKNDVNIAAAIESSYEPGTTVSFSGNISHTSRTETKIEEVAFGEPTVKSYVVVDKVYRICGGNVPLGEDDPNSYTNDEIKNLIEAYKKADVEKLEKAKEESSDTPTENNEMSKITRTRSSSLL